jgi:hypothetical protein
MELPETHLVIIPGQNGLGGQNIDTVLPYFENKPDLKHHVETPLVLPDLGQDRCMNYLKKTMSSLNTYKNVIIHASSQGTATAINYTAEHPKQVGALILEGIMLTGNSAIEHHVETSMLPGATSLPGSYYWMPYAAKISYPSYSPAGNQPIFNANKLPRNLPIIIIHHTNDPELSYKDAQGLYSFLKVIKKNDNVYFISTTSERHTHINLLDKEDTEEITAINTILKQNNQLLSNPNELLENIDLTRYQPKPKEKWLQHFNAILCKENKFWNVDMAIKTGLFGLLVCYLSSYY